MPRSETGVIVSAEDVVFGSSLIAALPDGNVTVELADVTQFDEAGGEVLLRNASTGAETVTTYIGLNDAADTITLGASVGALPVDSIAEVSPRKVTRYAHVRVNDHQDNEGDTLYCRVPHALYDKVPAGTRDADGLEWVVANYDGTEWVIADVLARKPATDYDDNDGTIPPPDPSDGSPPASSPTPTLRSGIGMLFVEWDGVANNDPVTYDVHISTSSGFVASGANKHGEMQGTIYPIRAMPNGDALAYDTTYYVKLVARDFDGSASESPQASAQISKVTGPDIAAANILAEHIVSGTITAEELASVLVISNLFRAGGSTGQRVEFDTAGIRVYASDDTLLCDLPSTSGSNPYFRAVIEALGIDVTGNATLRGSANAMSTGSKLGLASSGVSDPTSAPTLQRAWDQETLGNEPSQQLIGLTYDSGNSRFWFCQNKQGGQCIAVAAADKSNPIKRLNTGADYWPYGAVGIGGDVYALVKKVSTGRWRLWKYTYSTGALVSQTDLNSHTGDGAAVGPLTYDGTYLLYTYSTGVRAITLAGALQSNTAIGTVTGGDTLASVGGVWHIMPVFYTTTLAYTAFTSTAVTGTFKTPTQISGLAHDGTRFWSSNTQTTVNKHTTWNPPTSGQYFVKYSWYKSTATTAESKASPSAFISSNSQRYAKLRITLPTIPSPAADKARLWMVQGAAEPAESAFERQSDVTATTNDLSDFITTNSEAILSTSTFTGGNPAEINANAGNAQFRGDGLIRIGQFAATPSSNIAKAQVYYDTDDDTVWIYNGSAWKKFGPQDKLDSLALLLGATQTDLVGAEETRSNTAFGDLATVGPTVTVTARASGMVMLVWSVRLRIGTAGGFALASPERSGLAAHNDRSASNYNTSYITSESHYVDSGLSPGTAYTYTLKYATSSGHTGTFSHRRLTAIPL